PAAGVSASVTGCALATCAKTVRANSVATRRSIGISLARAGVKQRADTTEGGKWSRQKSGVASASFHPHNPLRHTPSSASTRSLSHVAVCISHPARRLRAYGCVHARTGSAESRRSEDHLEEDRTRHKVPVGRRCHRRREQGRETRRTQRRILVRSAGL